LETGAGEEVAMNLDEQREASMADEGGASGAAMEAEERPSEDFLEGSRIADAIVVGSAFVLGALAALTFAAIWRGGE
jgi:hypothetical protein